MFMFVSKCKNFHLQNFFKSGIMEITLEKGVRKLVLDRQQKKNAISLETYKKITKILIEDSVNDEVIITIITARGDFFSSGNDFQSSLLEPDHKNVFVVKDMIDAFIKYPKILIAVVNGPAIGIAATFITLCDIIYCSDRATFEIPFIRLGLSLEGCSSYTFCQLLGKSKASEMLFLNHILTAKEAYNLGFVSELIPHDQLELFIGSLYKFGALPLNSVLRNKELFTRWSKNDLLKCNAAETTVLQESIQSDEFMNAITAFLQKKSKL